MRVILLFSILLGAIYLIDEFSNTPQDFISYEDF